MGLPLTTNAHAYSYNQKPRRESLAVQDPKRKVVGMAETEQKNDDKAPRTVGGWVKFLTPILGGAATVALQIYMIVLQGDLQNKQNELAGQQHELSRQVTVSDRYNQAALHLGSEDPIQRIAGIYGLRDLASDDEKMGPRSLRLLASYLVHNNGTMTSNERAVASGILTILTREYEIGDDSSLSYDLANVQLPRYSLRGLQSNGGYFFGLNVSGANLSGAQLVCTSIEGANLSGANLSDGAKLDKILVNGQTDFSNIKGATPKTFGDLYWDEAPIMPPDFILARAGTLSDYGEVC